LRFGTKNLTESQKKELIVKSIMETIDQHGLRNVIKNKLTEQDVNDGAQMKYDGIALKILGMIDKAFSSMDPRTFMTNFEMIGRAIKMIPSSGAGKQVYSSLLKLVQTSPKTKSLFGSNYNTVMELIETEFSQPSLRDPSITNAITGQDKWLQSYSSILRQYNKNEVVSMSSSRVEG